MGQAKKGGVHTAMAELNLQEVMEHEAHPCRQTEERLNCHGPGDWQSPADLPSIRT